MMKKVLYIGRFFSPIILESICDDTKGRIIFSNHNFEMSLINGFLRHKEIDLSIITLPNYYSFPQHSKTFYVRSEELEMDGVPVKSVGFCNLFLVNRISSTFRLLLSILSYCRRNKDTDEVNIIINTPKCSLLLATFFTKLFTSKRIVITLIIPDIPSMITSFNEGSTLFKRIIGIEDSLSMRLSSRCDYFVLLTDDMKDFFNKGIKYMVMEGLIDESSYSDKVDMDTKKRDKLIVLYTGTLNRYFGIIRLLDAFEMLNRNDAELWICGSGDTREEIEKRCQNNRRIKFWGLVDVDTAKRFQIQADVLVNPRGSEGVFTKYSFPSKTLEYLMAGRVVIINKLPGIPDEYLEYVCCPKDESAESLAETIGHVLDMTSQEREMMGSKGRHFVLTKKNSYTQTGKILNMIFNNR